MMAGRHAIAFAAAVFASVAGSLNAQEAGFDFEMFDPPRPVPEVHFDSGDDSDQSLEDFRGSIVLLNVWATWCPPCREELPALEALQRKLGGAEFQVVALSTDTGRIGDVQSLYRELDLDAAGIHVDRSGSAMRDLGIFALPTTLLIDAHGKEVGRKVGPAIWDNETALAFFREHIENAETGIGTLPE